MLLGHGDDGHLYQSAAVANFSSNVYYPGFSEDLGVFLSAQMLKVKNYPEPNSESLRKALAKFHVLEDSQLLVTNGATDAFYLVAHAFKKSTATIVIPSFAEYEDACRLYGMEISFLAWDGLKGDTRFGTSLVFICNPNNPNGAIVSKEVIRCLLNTHQDTVFVLDEAYIDFTFSVASSVDLLKEFPNLLIVKSLTKTFAIPGLRLGYLLGSKDMITRISRYKIPWSVNTLAVEAGKYIVENHEALALPLKEMLAETKTLRVSVNSIRGIQALESHTTFFLCHTAHDDAASLKDFLMKHFRLLIRDASNFRGLSKNHFRIASQSAEENKLLIKALATWSARF
jgi:threonine-phosphate decarboxylase